MKKIRFCRQSTFVIDYLLNYIILKLFVSEQETANKKIADLETELQTLKRKVEKITDEKIKKSSGN